MRNNSKKKVKQEIIQSHISHEPIFHDFETLNYNKDVFQKCSEILSLLMTHPHAIIFQKIEEHSSSINLKIVYFLHFEFYFLDRN